jgi:hypothetical protein
MVGALVGAHIGSYATAITLSYAGIDALHPSTPDLLLAVF